MRQKRILLFAVALTCGLGLILPGCDNNPLPEWVDPWPTGEEAPTLTAPSPDSGGAGATGVKLSGSNINPTADNNFVLLGAGTGFYLCEVTAASASEVTVTIPDGADNLPFDEWTIIDTIMGYHFTAYPDSEIASIDTVVASIETTGTVYDTTWGYDTNWTVYDGPETVTTSMAQTSDFVFKMSARGSELWSNTISFNVIPPDDAREYLWPTLVVISKVEEE